jgi:hypothetical protein
MTHVIRLKTNFSEHRLQSVRLDNAVEFSSRAFNDYCMAQVIEVQHSVPYVHTQHGLDESLIKRIKLIARPLLHNCKCHVVLHATDLIQLRPTAYHSASPAMSCTWECFKHFPSVKIWLHCIYTNFTTAAYHDGSSQKNGYVCGISFSIHYIVHEAHDWGFIYGPVC